MNGVPPIVVVHPTGNQNSRQAALAAYEAACLDQFITALSVRANRLPWSLLPRSLHQEFSRRDFQEFAPGRANGVAPARELIRLLAPRLRWRSATTHESGWACIDAVYQAVDRAAARHLQRARKVSAVHAYEDGALASLAAAHSRGGHAFYELPIGYWREHRRLCAEEAERAPAWASTWTADADSPAKCARKDEELAHCDTVIVPGRFVQQTLASAPIQSKRVVVIPYGCPAPIAFAERKWYSGGPLKILFAGGLSQRKGLSYLLEAARPFGASVSLSIIGGGPGAAVIREQMPTAKLLGTMPHTEVLAQMRLHDVFVFPSLFEGFALVIPEALAQGLPVIATPNAGSSDLLDGTAAGHVVPIRDSQAISAHIESMLSNPSLVPTMARAALHIAERHSWSGYRVSLRAVWNS